MTDQDIRTVLARMAGARSAEPHAGAMTPARAVRLALSRAVEGAAGLKVVATSVSEETGVLDDLVATVSDDDLVLSLMGPKGLEGLAALDRELRSALVEVQTMGRISTLPAPDRPVSVVDGALAVPVVDAFAVELAIAAAPTSLADWTEGVTAGARLDGPRGVGLKLKEDRFRILRIGVDLGVSDREGVLVMALPVVRRTPEADTSARNWAKDMERALMRAPAVLTAVLARRDMPLARLKALRPGDLLPLGGTTVSSVWLEGPGGTFATAVRLGQVGGMKAVRLEAPAERDMTDVLPGAGGHRALFVAPSAPAEGFPGFPDAAGDPTDGGMDDLADGFANIGAGAGAESWDDAEEAGEAGFGDGPEAYADAAEDWEAADAETWDDGSGEDWDAGEADTEQPEMGFAAAPIDLDVD